MKLNVEYVNELKKKHGYTLGQLHMKTGLSRTHWSRIISGKRGIGLKSFNAIMKVFPEADMDKIFLNDVLPISNKM